jgi:hypothetical protein
MNYFESALFPGEISMNNSCWNKNLPYPIEQCLYPVLLITVTGAIVSSRVTVAPVIGPIIILVTVWIPVIVSMPVVPVVVVAPAVVSVIAERVSVTVMATYSKSKREMS